MTILLHERFGTDIQRELDVLRRQGMPVKEPGRQAWASEGPPHPIFHMTWLSIVSMPGMSRWEAVPGLWCIRKLLSVPRTRHGPAPLA